MKLPMKIVEDYSSLLTTLDIVSFDKENKIAMIQDTMKKHRMINFDGVKKRICKYYRGEELSSCDGMLIKDNCRYLIEFKNQSEGNIDKVKISNKAFDSVALLTINENLTREQIAKNTIFIVVYNNNKYDKNAKSYAPSQSMDKFAMKLKSFAKKEGWEKYQKKFDSDKYIGTFYKSVYTVDLSEFMNDFFDEIFN